MKVTSQFLRRFHLDRRHGLLSTRSVALLREYFTALDVRRKDSLDDLQFLAFIMLSTDLSESQAYSLFDVFDVDGSGTIEFDEFYLLTCMLISVKDHEEKKFLYHHSRTCFELLDQDGSASVSPREFLQFGFLFGFKAGTVRSIFKEFDFSGDKELDYDEFRMFTIAAIDRQKEIDARKARRKAEKARPDGEEGGMCAVG